MLLYDYISESIVADLEEYFKFINRNKNIIIRNIQFLVRIVRKSATMKKSKRVSDGGFGR